MIYIANELPEVLLGRTKDLLSEEEAVQRILDRCFWRTLSKGSRMEALAGRRLPAVTRMAVFVKGDEVFVPERKGTVRVHRVL